MDSNDCAWAVTGFSLFPDFANLHNPCAGGEDVPGVVT